MQGEIENITISPRETPVCKCGAAEWIVKQRIDRESDLEKVDGLGDLKVNPADHSTYRQALALQCNKCEALYQPQAGVEVWFEGGDGSESGYAWPERIQSDSEYEA